EPGPGSREDVLEASVSGPGPHSRGAPRGGPASFRGSVRLPGPDDVDAARADGLAKLAQDVVDRLPPVAGLEQAPRARRDRPEHVLALLEELLGATACV